jgi:regulator of protease activity HflC (stomatin/prohibitin superfamily)
VENDSFDVLKKVGVALFAIALVVVALSSWVNVPQGTVGVVFDRSRGGVLPDTLREGWHFRNPLTQSITVYPVALRTYATIGAGENVAPGEKDEPSLVTLPTQGGQHIDQQMAVTYHVDPAKAAYVFDKFQGRDIEEIEGDIVRRNIQSVATAITGQYDLMDVLGPKKAEIQGKMLAGIRDALTPYGFIVDQVNLGYAKPPAAIEQSLQLKMQQEQQADAAKYALQKAEMEAKAKIATAKGEAESNNLVRQQLSPEFLKFRALEGQEKTVAKWDEKLPSTIMGGGSIPLINMTSALSEK